MLKDMRHKWHQFILRLFAGHFRDEMTLHLYLEKEARDKALREGFRNGYTKGFKQAYSYCPTSTIPHLDMGTFTDDCAICAHILDESGKDLHIKPVEESEYERKVRMGV